MLRSFLIPRYLFCSQLYSKSLNHQCTNHLLNLNPNLSSTQLYHLQDLLKNNQIPEDKKKLNLLIYLLQKISPSLQDFRFKLAHYILHSQITSNTQLDKVLKKIKSELQVGVQYQDFNWNQLEKEYFRSISNEEIVQLEQAIKAKLDDTNPHLVKCNAHKCTTILNFLKSSFQTLPSDLVYRKFNQFLNHCCSQTSQNQDLEVQNPAIYEKLAKFEARDLLDAQNTKEQYDRHIAITKGKLVLRFPPEPNGHLHLGHLRAIRLNFHSAEKLGGICYLRFDDTNPETEKQCYIDEIQQNLDWLGHAPYKVTYSSDYFPQLFECAIKLIKMDKAYICEQNQEQITEYRKNKQASPQRNRSIDESLTIFKEMQQGKHVQKRYTLRLKIDHQHNNTTLRDPVIYRVKWEAHPRTGNQWNVYPTYDFAHCICDSLENITHSLCTLEFEIRRELYYWILNQLDMYKPMVYEFSRLNIENQILSKRNLKKLIDTQKVDGWNDPRLLTLVGLRKRGYTPTALNSFIDLISVSRAGNENFISIQQLEKCIRKELDENAPRLMVVFNPVLLRIESGELPKSVEIPIHPKKQQMGQKQVEVCQTFYIERSDIKLQDEDEYYGLAPSKRINLKYLGVIECTDIEIDSDKRIKEIKCKLISTTEQDRKKVKGQIHWVSQQEAQKCEIREYSNLFDKGDSELLERFNKNSYHHLYDCLVGKGEYEKGQRYQFERQGYYIVDEIVNGKVIFNKIVSLRK